MFKRDKGREHCSWTIEIHEGDNDKIDRTLATYPNHEKISNEPITVEHDSSSNKTILEKKKKKKKNSSIHFSFFTAQIPLFRFRPFIRGREEEKEKKNETQTR